MKERVVPWPKHVKISKEDFRPYINMSDLIEQEKFKEMLDSDEESDIAPPPSEVPHSAED